MLLMGTLTQTPMLEASRTLAEVLPGVRVEWWAEKGHVAMRIAPETVARLLREFLAEP